MLQLATKIHSANPGRPSAENVDLFKADVDLLLGVACV